MAPQWTSFSKKIDNFDKNWPNLEGHCVTQWIDLPNQADNLRKNSGLSQTHDHHHDFNNSRSNNLRLCHSSNNPRYCTTRMVQHTPDPRTSLQALKPRRQRIIGLPLAKEIPSDSKNNIIYWAFRPRYERRIHFTKFLFYYSSPNDLILCPPYYWGLIMGWYSGNKKSGFIIKLLFGTLDLVLGHSTFKNM